MFLALVFAGGFVIFGVGAGGVGVGDILRDSGGGSGAPSVGKAREKTAANPKDAAAWRELATALQTAGDADASIPPLERYTKLRPRDRNALSELAGLYLSRANRMQQEAQLAQLEASYVGGGVFAQPLELGQGQTLGADQITQAVQADATRILTDAYTKARTAYDKAEATYKRLAKVAPDDPNVQLELAQTAQQGGDVQGAIAAYERFLELAPEDQSAPIVKQQLKELRKSLQPASGSSG